MGCDCGGYRFGMRSRTASTTIGSSRDIHNSAQTSALQVSFDVRVDAFLRFNRLVALESTGTGIPAAGRPDRNGPRTTESMLLCDGNLPFPQQPNHST